MEASEEHYSSDSDFGLDEEPESVVVKDKCSDNNDDDGVSKKEKNASVNDDTVTDVEKHTAILNKSGDSNGHVDEIETQKRKDNDSNICSRDPMASDNQMNHTPTDQKKKAHFEDNGSGKDSGDDKDIHNVFESPKSRDNTDLSLRQSRENTESSLFQERNSRRSGRRHNSDKSVSPPRRSGGMNIRHYTTMGVRDEESQVKPDSVSLRSQSSRASGFLSYFLDYMAERFIYQKDPFEKTLRRCPRVAFQVIDRATMPVSVESLFGSQEKRALPSYYYTSTDKHSAKTRRGTSGVGSSRRSSSSQSNSIADYKSLPPVDSPRNSTHGDMFRLEDFIPEEDENSNYAEDKSRQTLTSGKSNKVKREGNLPNIMVSDHSLNRKNSANRPITSSSSKTTKSLGLPGKPMRT